MPSEKFSEQRIFSGNVFIFHAFDIGDDINLEAVRNDSSIITKPLVLPKYFKKYHIPLAIDLPHPHTSSKHMSVKLHNFGAISLTYKIPFESNLEEIRKTLEEIENECREQSVDDARSVFNKINTYTSKAYFFHTSSSYLVLQVDHQKDFSVDQLKKEYSGTIAATLRFETQSLSEYHKNTIMASSIGYFRGDLIVIDTESAFVYDSAYEEVIPFFEFANIQNLELLYFDYILDQKLNVIYEERQRAIPLRRYLPFFGVGTKDEIGELDKLKVDISVITERLESSIKLANEPYFSELYALLVKKLDLDNLREAVQKKLDIIIEIREVLQHKIDTIREDLLTVLIIILIFIELVVGLLHYLAR